MRRQRLFCSFAILAQHPSSNKHQTQGAPPHTPIISLPLCDEMVKFTTRCDGPIARLCFVASLSALLWASLLCFRFQLRGGQSAHYNRLRSLALPIPATHGGVPLSDDKNDRGDINVGNDKFPFMKALRTAENKTDPCGGRYIYVHKLPPRFNSDMLRDCKNLSPWTDMCMFTANSGLGPPMVNCSNSVFSGAAGWYATNQFVADVIFNARMKQYECLTDDSSVAAAVFVPFYAGFDVARHLWGSDNVTVRDATALDLVEWLVKRKEWDIMGGKDHFLVAGRTAWDFRRLTDKDSDWGNKLLLLPAVRNMSTLVIESSPWDLNDFAIPYPTYFHPEKDDDVLAWQDRMRKTERKWLFSFVGGARPGSRRSIRARIINQCNSSQHCRLMQCSPGPGNLSCHSPSSVMRVFQGSRFCLHPQGDSYTRRSAFDSILAGCIPVFFHPGSAYTQYTWHLPKEYTKYSVFIPEDDIRKKNASIEERLSRIPPKKVEQMREEVISLIPRIVYADPRAKLESVKDAFDVAVEAVIERVTRLRRNMVVGLNEHDDLMEGNKEWDGYFSEPKD